MRVLFVCTHNSARSIMAEALLREKGGPRFEAHSAGTHPGEIRPMTLRVLSDAGVPIARLRSKPLEEYLNERFDFVVTVCDDAQAECPTFPGGGVRMHWSYDDPSAVTGSDTERLDAFRRVFQLIDERIDRFVNADA